MGISKETIVNALRPIEDPDLRRSIVELELVKEVAVERGTVRVGLELATPLFDGANQLQRKCRSALEQLPGVEQVEIDLGTNIRGAPATHRRILKSVRNIIAVASGKGGVAKSTTAVNLALALHRAGARVGVLDADIYGPSVPMMLAVEQGPTMGPHQRLNPAVAQGMKMISMGFFVPEGRAAILRGPMVSGYVGQFLGNVEWGELDYLVIDYPPGTGDIQLTLSQQAPITAAIVCTTPQEISLIDVHKAMAMFETTKIPVLGVVETMSYFVCDGCGKRHDIFRRGGGRRIADVAGVPFLGEVPLDPRVAEGGDRGSPIVAAHPGAPAAVAYIDIARFMAAQLAVLNIEHGQYLESFSLKWDASR